MSSGLPLTSLFAPGRLGVRLDLLTFTVTAGRRRPMARKPRVEFAGAFYHVIARGNRRDTLFHDAEDFSAHLTRRERYRQRDGLTC